MTNIAICGIPVSDVATVVANNVNALFPASKLLTMQPRDYHRTTDLTSVYYTVDLGSAQAFNLISFLATNATATDTWRIRTADTEAGLTAAPDYDSGSVTLWASANLTNFSRWPGYHYISAGATNRWIRIDITSTAAAGYFQAGRLRIDNAWIPGRNIGYGWSMGFADDTEHGRGHGPRTFVTPKDDGRRRVVTFSLDFGTESDMYDNAFDLDLLCGKSKDVLIIKDVGDTTYRGKQSLCGPMMELAPIVNTKFGLYSKRYRIEELP